MDLQTGKFYWPETIKNKPAFPVLKEDIECDVLIIGGGSSGSQCVFYLMDKGLDVVVVEANHVSSGSTATNTALIQYLGEKFYHELVHTFGEERATRHVKLCEQAITDLETASKTIPRDAQFVRRDSLYFASDEEGAIKLEKEYELLVKHGFNVEMWDEINIESHYHFKKQKALYLSDDAELNPVALTYGLFEMAREKGVRIFEQTLINGKKYENGIWTSYTANGNTIKAKHLIIAAGYETLEFKKHKNLAIESTYAVVTNVIDDLSSWHNRTLIWETARPYIYLRTTPDQRVIIGGLDETTDIAEERDSKLHSKKERLIVEFNKLFPHIQARAEYFIGAAYGGTTDGLPMIGCYDDMPNCYHIYAYGDNGTVYNMVLGKVVGEMIVTGHSPNFDLYVQTRSTINGY
ncbi:NAD(P)/FAD-dependent oxidoreductase [Peribacillus acanthi]|uniref:NAD(P)/FAD-dependent oxidoreductase n=1 Tax=Peribacillus acanthi TaxID=2171554 RepID=UPI000D3ECD63|nr:FAD-dependent oxidoreductase [Peribacillus acanthi]